MREVARQDWFSFTLDVREFMPIVRDMMLLGFVQGFKNRPIGNIELARNPFRRQMRNIDKFLEDEQLGRIVDDFSTRALEELGRVDRSLQPYVQRILRANNTQEVQIALRGLMAVADARIKTVARTATAAALNAAHYLYDQQPEVRDRIWGYRYVTQADERVRDEHWAMHGVIQPKEHPIWDIWWPPNGWNCRCILVTLFDEYWTVEPNEVDGGMPMPDPGFATNPGQLVGA